MYKTKEDIIGLVISNAGTRYKIEDNINPNYITIDFVDKKGTASNEYSLKVALVELNKGNFKVISTPSPKINEIW